MKLSKGLITKEQALAYKEACLNTDLKKAFEVMLKAEPYAGFCAAEILAYQMKEITDVVDLDLENVDIEEMYIRDDFVAIRTALIRTFISGVLYESMRTSSNFEAMLNDNKKDR